MKWTRTPPSSSGFYWWAEWPKYSGRPEHAPYPVRVLPDLDSGRLGFYPPTASGPGARRSVDAIDGIWCGPIAPPEIPDSV
jgi:hypothetical protein